MKKRIIYTGAIAIAMLGITAGVITTNTAEATESYSDDTALTDDLNNNITQSLSDKDENVFVITDADGAVKSKFIGSTLYTGSSELPFSYNVRYYLDGTEISASELAGKSGHVKMVYGFESTVSYGGAKVPFVILSGMQLDGTKFSNVSVSSGKIVSEGEDYTIVGYALAGAGTDLGVDFLPEEFSVEADVDDFEMGTVYSIVTNELFAEIDTSKLSEVDSLVSQVNQLSSGLDQIISGASSLSEGLGTALAGAKELNTGAKTLASGVSSAATGANELSSGLTTLSGYNDSLNGGAEKIFEAFLTTVNKQLSGYGVTLTSDNYANTLDYLIAQVTDPTVKATLAATKGQLAAVDNFRSSLSTYTAGVANAANGASELSTGLTKINNGATALANGTNSLVSGLEQLYDGSVTLNSGLATFKTSGIDKLVNFANNDMASFTNNARRMVTAASSYHSFDNTTAESVKFIIKTASIK